MLQPETESTNGSHDETSAKDGVNLPLLILVLLGAILLVGVSYFGFTLLNRFEEMEAQLEAVGQKVERGKKPIRARPKACRGCGGSFPRRSSRTRASGIRRGDGPS